MIDAYTEVVVLVAVITLAANLVVYLWDWL
jgi:hypothetical protein